jgi:hypothetical protein
VQEAIEVAQLIGDELGVILNASGATEPGLSSSAQRTTTLGQPAGVLDRRVFHRAWTGAAVLHRSVLGARIRELHFGRCELGAHAVPELWIGWSL